MSPKTKITDPRRILTLANFISLSRALLAVPIVYTLRDPSLGTITFILVVIAILSDALDGWVARKAHEVTHAGKWIDPIADFLCLLGVVSYLTLVGRFPGWFFVFYLVRYVWIAVSAIYFLNHSHFILHSNWWGKWATGITSLATFLLVVSWLVYIKSFYQAYKEIH